MSGTSAIAPPRGADAARFAMSGRSPRLAWRPENAAEVAEAVRTANEQGLSLVPWGGGVTLARETAPERYDVALDLSALKRVIVHDPEDFTISAECGLTVAELRDVLAAHGQELPLEAAEAWGATFGGVLAANASGPRRRVFGAPRDRLLGARFVTGDGVLARTGGRVVKNVAGHAVHRLLVGSRGALGVFVEASLKLPPLPMGRLAMAWGMERLDEPRRWSAWPRREPAVLTVLGRALADKHPVLASGAPCAVIAGFEDDPAWLGPCEAFAHDTLGTARIKVRDAGVPALWQQLADTEEMPGVRLTFTSAHLTPDAVAFLAATPVADRFVFHAPCGRLHVWPAAEQADDVRREIERHDFTCLEARGASTGRSDSPLSGLRARVRAALDPAGVFALGERWAAGTHG